MIKKKKETFCNNINNITIFVILIITKYLCIYNKYM